MAVRDAERHIEKVAERWMEAKAKGRVGPELEEEIKEAEQACRRACRRLADARRRIPTRWLEWRATRSRASGRPATTSCGHPNGTR